ncbi:MAG TPA: HAD family phosphatase [Candidatus Atopostipes pullistercoris]|uniref:HAD family phosphatase n=1 Tax=Candidatus Atopostipes pullistercoris TaxID=2838467 RepID=A0A9D2G371_9LACT|nr:HAD family phosphatase [Candidatus Atopostipes pullistercoris]
MAKGIIFDFNGTMVFDAHLHEKAWVEMIQKHNHSVTEQEVIDYIHGRTNDQTIRHFIGDVTDEELQSLSDEKEKEYHRLAREEKLDYVDGTEKLLDQLVEKNIPFTIATASPKINIDFYFDYFKLDRWFTPEEIVYDDGTFPGKPDPTIYKKAAESLNLDPKDCVVIEDATAGVLAANRANIGQVFVMVYSEEQRALFNRKDYTYKAMIENFNHFLEMYIQ